jgi:dienelactone hydrolase
MTVNRSTLARIVGLSLFLAAQAAAQAAQAPSANPFAPYEGTYRLPTGKIILVGRVGVVDEVAEPFFLDWETGRLGDLKAQGEDRFTALSSSSARPDSPPQTEIAFYRGPDGTVAGLTIREVGLAERRAERVVLYRDEEAFLANGEVKLAATLRRPMGQGPFPAVVLVHGSGPGDRNQHTILNAFFAGLGLAVLNYDKRGCGASGGDWKKVDLDVLAQDALAGVRWLKAQPGIDPKAVGLWGFSQGGWITPLAASLDDAPAFIINSSGPATSLRRQDTYSMANTVKRAGFTPEDVAQFLRGYNIFIDFCRGKASAAELDAVMEEAKSNPKFQKFILPPAKFITAESLYARDKTGDAAAFFHLDPDNDALTPYRRLRCPALVTYGRMDPLVPVEESVGLLEAISAEGRRKPLTVKVISDTGHGLLRTGISPSAISREFFGALENWLRSEKIIGRT